MDNPETEKDRQKMLKTLGLFSVIVTELVGYTGAGVGIGWFLWKKWGAHWIFVLVFTLAGFGMAMYQVYRLSKTAWSDSADGKDDGNGH